MANTQSVYFLLPLALFAVSISAQESGRRAVLEEVVVTAQKRSESIRDVPMSVSAIGGESLRDFNIENMNDLSLMTPNVKFNVTPVTTFINIRGLGTGENRGFEQSVGLIVDGVYYGRGSYLNGAMLDMERIEVLRGPQGTLFGKNTIAGAVNIKTGQAKQEFEGDFSYLQGDFDQQRYTAMITGPVLDTLYFRLAFSDEEKDGYIFNTHKKTDDADLSNRIWRAKMRWDALETLSVEYAVSENNVERHGGGMQLRAATDESLALYRRADPATETDDSNFQTSRDAPNDGGVRDIENHTLTIDWDIADFTLTSITGLSEMGYNVEYDGDFSAMPLLILRQDENYEQFSEELRILSPPGKFEYVAGLYYFRSTHTGHSTILSAPEGDGAFVDSISGLPVGISPLADSIVALVGTGAVEDKSIKLYDKETTTKAIFGQATWWLSDRLSVIFGYRYGEETQDMVQSLRHENTGILFRQMLNEEPYNESNSRSEADRSPKFSIKYDLTDNINLYATYAKGFKSGGFNPEATSSAVLEYEAEEATTIEVGSKMRLLDGAMTLNMGLFDTEFDNLQVALINGTAFYVGNAAAVRTRGFEMDSTVLLSPDLVLTLSAGYTDAKYSSFPDGPCQSDGDGAAGPNPRERDDNGTCKQDLTGQPLSRAPRWNGAVGIQYQFGLFDWPVRVVTGANVMYQDEHFLSVDLDPIDTQPAYTQLNVQVGFKSEDESWSLMFFGRNLTDEVVRIEANDVPLFEGDHYSIQDLPRTYSAELRWRWW